MIYSPHDYQKRSIKFLIRQACGGLLLAPGMGKTSSMLQAFVLLKKLGYVSRMLIVAPLRPCYEVWPEEILKWDEFKHLDYVVLHGSNKDDLLTEDHDVYIINPEGLPWLMERMKHEEWWWDIFCLDESTQFKHTQTVRFHTLRPHLPRFRRRYILTGSPAPNGLMDLYGQIFILDLGHALGPSFSRFRNDYFDSTGFGGYTWVPRADTAEKIYKKIAPLVLRLDAADYLKLPPLTYNIVKVTLPPAAMKAYREMENLLITELDNNMVTAANAAVATMKVRQIANGGIYGEGDFYAKIHDAKTDAVQELVNELQGSPALVAYEFKHDRERLLQRLSPNTPWIGGGVSPKRFAEIKLAWNAGRVPILLAHPKSVAHGLNLQGTRATVISHSLGFDLEKDEQFIRRVWRQGQKHPVMVHRIVAKGTIDEVILEVLGKKDKTQRALLDALKTKLRRRS